jgi:glycosyltransferase involved in cell wall biosynthesis
MRSAVRFAGFLNQTEMARAYAAADLLVLPSEARETWGLVVNEAMASGRAAIVSSAAGCTPDLIVEGVTGHSYAVGDMDRLAALLRAAAAQPAELPRMSEAARRHVAAFSAAAAADGVIQGATQARARRAA